MTTDEQHSTRSNSQVRNVLVRAVLDFGRRQLEYEKRERDHALIKCSDRAQAIMQKYRKDTPGTPTTKATPYV